MQSLRKKCRGGGAGRRRKKTEDLDNSEEEDKEFVVAFIIAEKASARGCYTRHAAGHARYVLAQDEQVYKSLYTKWCATERGERQQS